jgi:putative ABC transport system substrate-binding protein
MKRRGLLALGAAAAGAPAIAARAQRSLPLVGVLMAGAESSEENRPRIAAFRSGLADLGWRDGETVRIEYRWSAGRMDTMQRHAEELIALAPNVIVANSTSAIVTVKKLSSAVPVVFALAIDPVGLGQVQSLSRPGGNMTGFTYIDPDLIGKWMGLLQQVKPDTARVAIVFNRKTMSVYDSFVGTLAAQRRSGAPELVALAVQTDEELDAAVETFARSPGGAMAVGPDPFNQVRIRRLAQLAARHRLPSVSVYRPFVAEGGLMAYGPDTADIFHRAAGYVDRILKGAKPADLPVQQPIKFEFAINLAAARALGVTISPTLRALADDVVD